jgi:hypothetical protein
MGEVAYDGADAEWPLPLASAINAVLSIRRIEPTMAILHRELFPSRPDYAGIVHLHAFATWPERDFLA